MALKRYEEKDGKLLVRYSLTKIGVIDLTGWIDPKTNPPVREGWYNTKNPEGLEHGDRHYWKEGAFWEFGMCAGVLRTRREVQVSVYQGLSSPCPGPAR